MADIQISFIDPQPSVIECIQDFERESGISVEVVTLRWDNMRRNMADYALFRKGPDISVTVTSLLGHFAHLNALRSFAPSELREIGSREDYPLFNWNNGVSGNQVFAIPWAADVRVIYYRRDVFEQLGIDEATAFSSVANLQETFTQLDTLEDMYPWIVPTTGIGIPLDNMTMWIHHYGGRLMSKDGRTTRFTEPEAMEGIKMYFRTYGSVLRPDVRGLDEFHSATKFRAGEVAMVVGGPWVISAAFNPGSDPKVMEHLGVASLPISPYLGGQSMVIWNYSPNAEQALQLINYLAKPETQLGQFQGTPHMSARLDMAVKCVPEQFSQTFATALERGDGYSANYLFGLVEDRLTPVIQRLWRVKYADSDKDFDQEVEKTMKMIARQLDRLLAQS